MKKQNTPLGPAIAVVLGAGINPDGKTPTPRTTARAEAAVQLALQQRELTVILSGDGRSEINRRKRLPSEADLMFRILRKHGVCRRRLLLERQACDTMGNAILCAARFLADQTPRHIYLVTSPFHAERALTMFRGVLGSAWTVELHASAIVEGDELKGQNEAGGIEWARSFFEKTVPGDITSAIDRLLEVGKSQYRAMPWLVSKRAA